MSSTEAVDRATELTLSTSILPENKSTSSLIYNYFTHSLKQQQTEVMINNNNNNTQAGSATLLSSTNNSCSSNVSSNSSSFIQLSNDDTIESVIIPAPASVETTPTTNGNQKHKKILKKINKKKLKFKQRSNNNNNSKAHNSIKFILNAFVNGFAQLKICADKIDYEYIIEIYWSNGMKTFIKRTYDDFVLFHRKLMQIFNNNKKLNDKANIESLNINNNSSNGQQQKVIPALPGKKLNILNIKFLDHIFFFI